MVDTKRDLSRSFIFRVTRVIHVTRGIPNVSKLARVN